MTVKKMLAGLLSAAVMVSLLAACGNGSQPSQPSTQDASGKQSASSTQTEQDSHTEQSGQTEESTPPAATQHTLYIRDADKHPSMTATFINHQNGRSEDVPMTKYSEDEDAVTYSCEADTSVYHMVHLTYGDETTMDVAFNAFVSGWYLQDGELLPYVEGEVPSYELVYETKVFPFNGYDKKVYIWTPPDYDAASDEKYTAIYMLDGQSVLSTAIDTTFNQGCWNVSEHIRSMMSQTDNKAILVAIETTGKERMDELIPDIGKTSEGAASFFGEAGTKQTGTLFRDFVCDTVVPYVDEHYHVYTDAAHRALSGSSLGGLETFYICTSRYDTFGTGGVLSASFGIFDDEVWLQYAQPLLAVLNDTSGADQLPFLYFYSGNDETDNGWYADPVYNAMVDYGYPKDKLVCHKYPAGEHQLAYWRNIYPEFLEAVFTRQVTGLTLGWAVPLSVVPTTEESSTAPSVGGDYVYFDNTETQWEKVYAYWWNDSFSTTTNKLTGEVYGESWPGIEMEPVEGTGLYRIVIPIGATKMIFNSGATEEEMANGTEGYQTADLPFDENANAGQIYTIDLSQPAKKGRGAEKTKYRYPAGAWTNVAS